jgi:hypothetical protein
MYCCSHWCSTGLSEADAAAIAEAAGMVPPVRAPQVRDNGCTHELPVFVQL